MAKKTKKKPGASLESVADWDRWMGSIGHPVTTRETWTGPVRRAIAAGALRDDEALAQWLGNSRWAATTRRSYTTAMVSYLSWARREGLRVPDPARYTARGRPRVSDPVPRALSADELIAVMKTPATADMALWVRLAYGAGLRAGEISRLRNEDLDLVEGIAYVRGKGRRERVVPLPPWLVDELARLPDRPGPLWPDLTPHNVSERANRHFRRAGVRHGSIHRLRHTHATQLLEDGADIAVIQRQLGHASLSTTQVYLTVRPERQREAVLRLAVPDTCPILEPRTYRRRTG